MPSKKSILNQRGQAAIFVALMFNVLFVFFAMAINVALVVHDKINLQNSVDLAAYYAASKQAEILNAIAHQNYAIRQSYKLMAWRYRVLGTMGLYRNDVHPVWSGEMNEEPFGPAIRPSVCVTYKPTWQEVPDGENLCNQVGLKIPPLPEVKVIAGFLGLNAGIAALSRQLRAQFDAQCQKHGAYNWWFAMSNLHAFRLDQRNRKQVIYALARNLSGGRNGDFIDLDGNSVLQGARETFIKNLTHANREAFENGGGEFSLHNSMAGIRAEDWLVEIPIAPTMIYTDVDTAAGCNASAQPVQNLPARPEAMDLINGVLNAGGLVQWRNADFLQGQDFQYSIGVEKNPWYMPFMGVKARTQPRQIFFPTAGAIEMVARSFAKPFGGRIGPWYSSKWEKGAKNSEGNRVDPLMAPRLVNGGLTNSPDDPTRLPNYSRFPGDTLGLTSKLALNAMTGLGGVGISFNAYNNIKADITPSGPNDPLAWEGGAPAIRNYEIAAIAPDLFDITYYSIEPNFTKNYWEKLNANKTKFPGLSNVVVRPDLGHDTPDLPTFSVQEQMALAQQRGLQKSQAFYFVRSKTHLLTSWLPGAGAYNYGVQASMANFGKCSLPDDGLKFKNPGSCVAGGGRTGYSVKLISRDFLFSNQHRIGGQGAAPNGLLNPPPKDGGW